LEKAIAAVWDGVPVQRCTVHKHRNLLAHAPKRHSYHHRTGRQRLHSRRHVGCPDRLQIGIIVERMAEQIAIDRFLLRLRKNTPQSYASRPRDVQAILDEVGSHPQLRLKRDVSASCCVFLGDRGAMPARRSSSNQGHHHRQ
jgi:hypothetical protein